MRLRKWEQLPREMQCQEVREYYDVLSHHKAALIFKRVFDIAASLLLIIILMPIFLILAVAIAVDSRGHVFFCQERVTAYGKIFNIIKFRTMVPNAEKLGTQVTVDNDMRVTRVGKFLRKCRLDELPQLYNVLAGDMTFVGTRPEIKKYVDAYSPEMLATLLLPAGITSEASIYYKDESRILSNTENVDEVYIAEVLPGKMHYNFKSIRSFSIIRDIKTMVKTVFAVLGKEFKGDYVPRRTGEKEVIHK